MKKLFAGMIAATLASLTGFVIHVFSHEWVMAWITKHIQGHEDNIAEAWDVRYIAAITSIETGIGLVVLYALLHSALPFKSSLVRGFALGILLLAVMGSLFRQPIMNLVAGNPPSVVIVQDGITWFTWLAASIIAALVYDALSPQMGIHHSRKPTPPDSAT